MSDALNTKVEMHIKEDDKRFESQAKINTDLYRRIDGINTKLWLLIVGVGGVLIESLLPRLFS